MFKGINIADSSPYFNSYGPVGSVFNGVTQTGAMHLRASSTTNANLANGNYIALAQTLATMNYDTTIFGNTSLPSVGTDERGTVLRYNKFPENFIYTSPQFSSVSWTGNHNNSNYHSMQAQITMRPTHGFNLQATYTWSKNIGALAYTDPRNRALDYGPNGMDRNHAVAINGGFELPFGPGRWLLNGKNGVLSRIAGGWQMSWIGNVSSGRPYSITPTSSTLYGAASPNRVGTFEPGNEGNIVWPNGASTGVFYGNADGTAKYSLVADPQCQSVTTAQGLQGSCTLRAFALNGDASKLVFVNPYPTERGNFAQNSLRQPPIWSADMTMSKSIRITEGKSLSIRMDATNIFNHAQPSAGAFQSGVVRVKVPGAPAAAMSGYFDFTDFSYAERPLGYVSSKVGSRTFQAKIRLDF